MAGTSDKSDSGSNNDLVSDNGELEQSGSDNNGAIDPVDLGDGNFERDDAGNVLLKSDGTPRKKRGRKPGTSGSGKPSGQSSNGTGKSNSQTVKQGLETLSQTLLIVHMGLANLMQFKGMELEKAESDALASSIANVMEQFDFAPDPRFTAIAGLVTTGATIYGPRIYLYREDAKEKRRNNPGKQTVDAKVSNINDFPHNLAG